MMSQEPSQKTTMGSNEVTVYLNETEAKQFISFRENYDNFLILANHKVFEQRGAAITLHFDKTGAIRNVTRSDVLYDYRFDFLNTN